MPLRPRLFWPLACAALASAGGSCSYDAGHDYAVTVTWLINGTAPDQELCDAQGIDRIRFTVHGPNKTHSLEAACKSSVTLASDNLPYGGFISTVAFDFGVSYDYDVEMLDSSGKPVDDLNYSDTFQVLYEDPVPWVLAPLELWDPGREPVASVYGSWTIDGKRPDATSCAQLGAGDVVIDIASSTDADFQDYYELARASCADGAFDSRGDPLLGEGEYVARYVLLDKNDDPLQEIPLVDRDQLIAHVVDEPGELKFDPVDFNP
jgi:hypothetical protein